ncbi:MAG: BTAD domain-containing putative transcriptional regulator [Nannocystaceae bacterium]
MSTERASRGATGLELQDYREDAARWEAAGRPDRAATLYAIAAELDPDDWDLRVKLAASLAACGRAGAAARHYVEIARHYVARHSLERALVAGQRVLQLHPGEFTCPRVSDIMLALGPAAAPLCRAAAHLHRKAGRDDEAAHLLQLWSQLKPRDPAPWRELAQLYFDHQMNHEAVCALRRAGTLLIEAGDLQAYVEFARTILWLEPRDLDTLRELPQVLIRMGEPRRAMAELAALLRVSPGDEVGCEALAHAFAAIGRHEASLSMLERLTHELVASNRRATAEAILGRARAWVPTDEGFVRRLMSLPARQPSSPTVSSQDPRPTTANGTVVLRIADLVGGAPSPGPTTTERELAVFDATELAELEEPALRGMWLRMSSKIQAIGARLLATTPSAWTAQP